jgi:hypothetical protein
MGPFKGTVSVRRGQDTDGLTSRMEHQRKQLRRTGFRIIGMVLSCYVLFHRHPWIINVLHESLSS